MLQQLQNLASDDIIHGYQTCPLVESFFPRMGAWTDVVCRIRGRRPFGVEFQVCWSNISLNLCARNESETFLKCQSILYRPPHSRIQFLNFVNKIFVISRLITKFTKILCHENLELYGILICWHRLKYFTSYSSPLSEKRFLILISVQWARPSVEYFTPGSSSLISNSTVSAS